MQEKFFGHGGTRRNVSEKRFFKKEFFSLGGLPPWTVSDGGEVYSPNVGGKRFLKKSSLTLVGCRRDEFRRVRSVLAERRRKAFFEKEFSSLGGLPPWTVSDGEEMFFSAASRKEPKESPQRGRTYGSPPLDSPTPVGMAQGSGIRLHEARIRRGSVKIALPRLFWSTSCPRFYVFRGIC